MNGSRLFRGNDHVAALFGQESSVDPQQDDLMKKMLGISHYATELLDTIDRVKNSSIKQSIKKSKQFKSFAAAVKEFEKETTPFKTRVAGINTVTRMLDRAITEVVGKGEELRKLYASNTGDDRKIWYEPVVDVDFPLECNGQRAPQEFKDWLGRDDDGVSDKRVYCNLPTDTFAKIGAVMNRVSRDAGDAANTAGSIVRASEVPVFSVGTTLANGFKVFIVSGAFVGVGKTSSAAVYGDDDSFSVMSSLYCLMRNMFSGIGPVLSITKMTVHCARNIVAGLTRMIGYRTIRLWQAEYRIDDSWTEKIAKFIESTNSQHWLNIALVPAVAAGVCWLVGTGAFISALSALAAPIRTWMAAGTARTITQAVFQFLEKRVPGNQLKKCAVWLFTALQAIIDIILGVWVGVSFAATIPGAVTVAEWIAASTGADVIIGNVVNATWAFNSTQTVTAGMARDILNVTIGDRARHASEMIFSAVDANHDTIMGTLSAAAASTASVTASLGLIWTFVQNSGIGSVHWPYNEEDLILIRGSTVTSPLTSSSPLPFNGTLTPSVDKMDSMELTKEEEGTLEKMRVEAQRSFNEAAFHKHSLWDMVWNKPKKSEAQQEAGEGDMDGVVEDAGDDDEFHSADESEDEDSADTVDPQNNASVPISTNSTDDNQAKTTFNGSAPGADPSSLNNSETLFANSTLNGSLTDPSLEGSGAEVLPNSDWANIFNLLGRAAMEYGFRRAIPPGIPLRDTLATLAASTTMSAFDSGGRREEQEP
jgi:hypothetical protein